MVKKIIYFLTSGDITGIQLALENKVDEKTICLLQNAVYFANKTVIETSSALSQGIKIIACKDDVEIRGLKKFILDGIELKDYEEIIDKIIENDSIINF